MTIRHAPRHFEGLEGRTGTVSAHEIGRFLPTADPMAETSVFAFDDARLLCRLPVVGVAALLGFEFLGVVLDGALAGVWLTQPTSYLLESIDNEGGRWDYLLPQIYTNARKICSECSELKRLIEYDPEPRNNYIRARYDARKPICMDCEKVHRARALRAAGRVRQVRELYAEGSHTAQEWAALIAACEGKCLRCKKIAPLTKDHVQPLSKGGADYIDNIQPLCRSCNSAKGTQWVDYRVISAVAVA